MANVITGSQYVTLANKYGDLINVLNSSTSYMYDALRIIAEMDSVEPTRDLIIPFDNVYQQQVGVLGSGAQFLEVVRALNSHVLTRARKNDGTTYSDINDWFDDQLVPNDSILPSWATLSAAAGVTIDDALIK